MIARDACSICGAPRALDVETETLKCARCQRVHRSKHEKTEDEDERAPDSGSLPYWHNVT